MHDEQKTQADVRRLMKVTKFQGEIDTTPVHRSERRALRWDLMPQLHENDSNVDCESVLLALIGRTLRLCS